MEWRNCIRAAGDSHPVASHRVQAVLEMAVAETPGGGKEADEPGTTGTYISHGDGESHLGRTADPWRVEDARV